MNIFEPNRLSDNALLIRLWIYYVLFKSARDVIAYFAYI